MIMAIDMDYGLGNDLNKNGLPWEDIKEDFEHFKNETLPITIMVMGRKTLKNILKLRGKPLPKREHVVLSSNYTNNMFPDVIKVFSSVEKIQEYLKDKNYVVIGGAQTYEAFAPIADEIVCTKIHATYPANCFLNSKIFNGFIEDKTKTKTIRGERPGYPKVTVHYFKK